MLLTVLKRAVKDFLQDNCAQMAAAISYYVLFSLFPLLIFLISVLGMFLKNSELQNRMVETIIDFIPVAESKEESLIIGAIRDVSSSSNSAISILGLLGMAWAASGMFAVIRNSINIAYDLEKRRSFVRQKIVDLEMVLVVGIFFLFSIGATALLEVLRRLSTGWAVYFPIPYLEVFIGETGVTWQILSYLIPFSLSFAAFYIIYWIVPAIRLPFRFLWPGTLAASILFELGKVGFIFYVENFARYDVVFGSLGTVVAFLFWVYISAAILLFGAEIGSEYLRLLARKKIATDDQ